METTTTTTRARSRTHATDGNDPEIEAARQRLFNPRSAEFLQNPYETYRVLREREPLTYYNELPDLDEPDWSPTVFLRGLETLRVRYTRRIDTRVDLGALAKPTGGAGRAGGCPFHRSRLLGHPSA